MKFKLALLIIAILRLYHFNSQVSVGDNVMITKRILREPAIYDNSQYIKIGRFRAYVDTQPELKYGDRISLKGKVSDNNLLQDPEILSVNKSSFWLFEIREKMINNFLSFLPSPHGAIIAGSVLGSQKGINDKFWQRLVNSGTAHIVVASGTNVTYTAVFLMSVLLIILKRRNAIIFALLGVWGYVALSGFDPPLVRAAIMGSLAFSAQLFGKVSNTINILLITVLSMLIINPVWASDIGFALSFYATASLILFESSIYALISKIPLIFKRDLSTTLAAQIGVAPILFFTFNQLNPLSPIYNVLVLWTIPFIMILGAISGLIGLFSFELGRLIALLIYPFTSWFVFIVNLS